MSPNLPRGLLPFLQDLVRIPSLSGTTAERRCAERVVAEMRACGLDEVWTDAAGNAIGVLYGQNEGAPGWVLLSHLDVVAAGDEGAWSAPPFGGELRGDLLHGRGTVDIKGAVASHLYALNTLAQNRPVGDTVMCVAAQEEIDGAGAAAFFTDLPLMTPRGRIVIPGACLVGEPSRNRLMLGHRGILRLTLRFPGQAHHAAAADHTTNPHFDLAVFLNRLRNHSGRVHPVLGPDTLTPTVIVSDTTSQNVTPGELLLVLDWRYGTLDLPAFEQQLQSLTEGLQVQYTVPPPWSRGPEVAALYGPTWVHTPGFLTPADHSLVSRAQKILLKRLPASLPPSVWMFATDGRYSALHGFPTLGCGPGDERSIHTAREALDLNDIPPYLDFLRSLLSVAL